MPDKVPDKVEVSVVRGPREPESKLSVSIKKEDDTLAFSKDTVFYMLYLLYKSNMVSRSNLKQMFRIVNDKMPDNVVKWLLEEAAKA